MVQNQRFAAAIDTGLAAAAVTARRGPLEGVIALIRPVVGVVLVREGGFEPGATHARHA